MCDDHNPLGFMIQMRFSQKHGATWDWPLRSTTGNLGAMILRSATMVAWWRFFKRGLDGLGQKSQSKMDDLWLGIPPWLRNPPFFKQKCSKVSKLYVLHLGGTLACYVFVLRHVCFLLTALMANHDWRPPFSVLISGNYWMHGTMAVSWSMIT
jgi:hypothetical protein